MSMPGKGGGGAQNTTTSTVAEPWQGVQPYMTGGDIDGRPIRGAYPIAQGIFEGGPPGFYPGSTLAQQSPYTQAAIGLQAERGLYGSPMVQAAQNSVGNIAGGSNANAFAPVAGMSNQAIGGMLQNPLMMAMSGQAGAAMNPLGQIAGGGANPVSQNMAQMGGYGLMQQGQQGTGVNPWLGGQASGGLAGQISQGNPFGGSGNMAALGNSLGTLQSQGAANPLMPTAQNALAGIAGGQGSAGAAGTQGAARDAMTRSLSGEYLSAGNPYFEGAINAATRPVTQAWERDILPGITSQFAAAGRYGSGAHEDAVSNAGEAVARQIGDMSSQMSMANYDAERGRMLSNTGLALQDAQGQTGLQLQGLGQVAGLRGQDLSAIQGGAGLSGQLWGAGQGQNLQAINSAFNALAGQGALQQGANQGLINAGLQGTGQQLSGLGQIYGNQFNMGNQQLNAAQLGQQGFLNSERSQLAAAGLAPQLAAQDYIDIGAIGQSGQMADVYNQAGIDADVDRWNYNANAPLDWTGNYLGMLNSVPWGSRTENSANQQQSGGGWLPAIGGIAGGLIGGYFGGPMGAMAGSSIGSMGGQGLQSLF